jgi:hypothetical protein
MAALTFAAEFEAPDMVANISPRQQSHFSEIN